MRAKWWVPLSGAVGLVLMATGFFFGGEPPEAAEASGEEIAKYLAAHGDDIRIAVFLLALAMVLLLIFASNLKERLAEGIDESGTMPRVAFAGMLLIVVGFAFDATLLLAMSEAAGKIDPVGTQTMMAIWNNDFIPIAVGITALNLAVAVSSLKYGGIPKWLGALSALIFVVSVIPPIGFFAAPATALWVLLASITMAAQGARSAPAAGFRVAD